MKGNASNSSFRGSCKGFYAPKKDSNTPVMLLNNEKRRYIIARENQSFAQVP